MRSVPHSHTRPIWAEISSTRLQANYRALRIVAGPAFDLIAVIKANAYGHGARECAPVLAAAGAPWLGVTSTEEGVAVRAALALPSAPASGLPSAPASELPTGPRILVMCGLWSGEAAACIDHRLTPVVWEPYQLDLLETEAQQRGLSPQSLPVHVEIDTGMARQGVPPGPLLDALLRRFTPGSPLHLEGVMTHLASTECVDDPQNPAQMAAFAGALQQVRAAGLRPAWVHAGNTSAADSAYIPTELPALASAIGARSMTRAGLALYGYALPLAGGNPHLQPLLEHVMAWKTRVVSLRHIAAGDTVGYNAAFVAHAPMRLALLPVGYADGFRRGLSSSTRHTGGAVLLHGQRAPILGRVSMDLTIVDVTHLPDTTIGDEVTLLGTSHTHPPNNPTIGADEHASLAGTSVYEVLCGISDRVPRIVTG